MTTRDELVAAIAGRYAWSGRLETGRILDEFVAVTKMHRKHAQRLLRQGNPRQRSAPRPGRRIYDEAAREALILVWEFFRSDLRQTAQASCADSHRGDGAAWPSQTCE